MREHRVIHAAVAAVIAASLPGLAYADAGKAFGGFLILTFFLIIMGVVYFLPTIVAANRQHPQLAAIFVVNLFLGWTLVGWVWALAWSLMAVIERVEPVRVVTVPSQPVPAQSAPAVEMPADPTARQLKALSELREQGLLTEEEYQEKRKKVLDTI